MRSRKRQRGFRTLRTEIIFWFRLVHFFGTGADGSNDKGHWRDDRGCRRAGDTRELAAGCVSGAGKDHAHRHVRSRASRAIAADVLRFYQLDVRRYHAVVKCSCARFRRPDHKISSETCGQSQRRAKKRRIFLALNRTFSAGIQPNWEIYDGGPLCDSLRNTGCSRGRCSEQVAHSKHIFALLSHERVERSPRLIRYRDRHFSQDYATDVLIVNVLDIANR